MSYQLDIRPDALAELETAGVWYEVVIIVAMKTNQNPKLRRSDISDAAPTGLEKVWAGGATKIPLLTELAACFPERGLQPVSRWSGVRSGICWWPCERVSGVNAAFPSAGQP